MFEGKINDKNYSSLEEFLKDLKEINPESDLHVSYISQEEFKPDELPRSDKEIENKEKLERGKVEEEANPSILTAAELLRYFDFFTEEEFADIITRNSNILREIYSEKASKKDINHLISLIQDAWKESDVLQESIKDINQNLEDSLRTFKNELKDLFEEKEDYITKKDLLNEYIKVLESYLDPDDLPKNEHKCESGCGHSCECGHSCKCSHNENSPCSCNKKKKDSLNTVIQDLFSQIFF